MSVLVTGAAGFVGTWLVERLARQGQAVTAQMRRPPSGLFLRLGLDSKPGVTVLCEEDCAAALTRTAPETVFHLAGMSQIREVLADPSKALEANSRQTWRLLDASRAMPTPPRTVIASTDSLYGESNGRASVEDDALKADGPYELSKRVADETARLYARLFGLPVTVARLGNVYGAGDANTARLVPSVMGAVKRGERPQLRGGGRALRALLYIDDCLDGLQVLAGHADREDVRGQAFNLSGGPPMTILDIANAVLSAMGRTDVCPQVFDDGVQETSEKFSSTEKLHARLGWEPRVSLDAGLTRLCELEEEIGRDA